MQLTHAFKEWAVVCAAVAKGEQAIILRKGGIDENFQVEQRAFWLYPTFTHQQQEGIKPSGRVLLEETQAQRPAAGLVRLSHWAEVTGVYRVHELMPALMLNHLHIWSEQTVEKRFHYRDPGLNVLAVRVYRAAQAREITETPAYHGCRSWAVLDNPLDTAGSVPVMSDADYRDLQHTLDLLLSPTALA
jgi:hypothetical protein